MIEGLSLRTEICLGSPLKTPCLIMYYWSISVLSNGQNMPRGLVCERYIFAMRNLYWKEGVLPFASADGLNGIVDTKSQLIETELFTSERRPMIKVLIDHPVKELTIALHI